MLRQILVWIWTNKSSSWLGGIWRGWFLCYINQKWVWSTETLVCPCPNKGLVCWIQWNGFLFCHEVDLFVTWATVEFDDAEWPKNLKWYQMELSNEKKRQQRYFEWQHFMMKDIIKWRNLHISPSSCSVKANCTEIAALIITETDNFTWSVIQEIHRFRDAPLAEPAEGDKWRGQAILPKNDLPSASVNTGNT